MSIHGTPTFDHGYKFRDDRILVFISLAYSEHGAKMVVVRDNNTLKTEVYDYDIFVAEATERNDLTGDQSGIYGPKQTITYEQVYDELRKIVESVTSKNYPWIRGQDLLDMFLWDDFGAAAVLPNASRWLMEDHFKYAVSEGKIYDPEFIRSEMSSFIGGMATEGRPDWIQTVTTSEYSCDGAMAENVLIGIHFQGEDWPDSWGVNDVLAAKQDAEDLGPRLPCRWSKDEIEDAS